METRFKTKTNPKEKVDRATEEEVKTTRMKTDKVKNGNKWTKKMLILK